MAVYGSDDGGWASSLDPGAGMPSYEAALRYEAQLRSSGITDATPITRKPSSYSFGEFALPLIAAAAPIVATEATGLALTAGEAGVADTVALGSEFGVQGNLASVLTSSGAAAGTTAGAIELGSEFGTQGDLAGVLANAGGSTITAGTITTAAGALKTVADFAKPLATLYGLAAQTQALKATGGAMPLDFSKTSSPSSFSLAPSSSPAAAAPAVAPSSSGLSVGTMLAIAAAVIFIAVVSHGG